MILKNRFNREDAQRYWWDHQYCGKCCSNKGVALHHIDGCKMWYHASLFNSFPACADCHPVLDGVNSGGIKGEKDREMMTVYTMKHLVQQGKEFNDMDKAYLNSIMDRVKVVLKSNNNDML